MKTFLRWASGLGLVVLGAGLEIWYYAARFSAEGEALWFAFVKGASLTLFLVLLSTKYRRKAIYAIVVPLVLYSVFCTSAGQATRYAERYNARKTEQLTMAKTAEEQEERKAGLTAEVDRLREAKARKEAERDAVPMDKRTVWQIYGKDSDGDPIYQKVESEVFRTINAEILAYQEELTRKESELASIGTVSVIVTEKESDPYYVLHNATRLPVELIQYILQAAFSLFSALMAPFGINLLIAAKSEPKPLKDPPPDWSKLVPFWVSWSWYSYRNGKSNKIVPEEAVIQCAQTRLPELTRELYGKIKEVAVTVGAIGLADEVLIGDESKARETIIKKITN